MSVLVKLASGFGLLLLITASIVAVYQVSADAVSEASEAERQLHDVQIGMLDVRLAQRVYQLGGAPEQAEAVLNQTDRLLARIDEIATSQGLALQFGALQELQAFGAGYRSAFVALTDATNKATVLEAANSDHAEMFRAEMVALAASAQKRAALLNMLVRKIEKRLAAAFKGGSNGPAEYDPIRAENRTQSRGRAGSRKNVAHDGGAQYRNALSAGGIYAYPKPSRSRAY